MCVVYSPGSCSYDMADYFFSCFINEVSIACLLIENQSKPLKQLKVGVLRIQVVIWVISKIEERICNLTIRLPASQADLFPLPFNQEVVSQLVKEQGNETGTLLEMYQDQEMYRWP